MSSLSYTDIVHTTGTYPLKSLPISMAISQSLHLPRSLSYIHHFLSIFLHLILSRFVFCGGICTCFNICCLLSSDTISLFYLPDSSTKITVPLLKTGNTWWSDKNVKFNNPKPQDNLIQAFAGKVYKINSRGRHRIYSRMSRRLRKPTKSCYHNLELVSIK